MKHRESCKWKNAVVLTEDQLGDHCEWTQKYLKENYKRMQKECKCPTDHKPVQQKEVK